MILSQNMQSLNIPNAKAQDLEPLKFNSHKKLAMVTTSSHHIKHASEVDDFKKVSPKTSNVTINGNNISAAEQISKMANNETAFRTATKVYNKIIGLYKNAAK